MRILTSLRPWSTSKYLEILFAAANAQLFHSRLERRCFEAEHFRGTSLPPYPPMRRLQYVAEVLGVDFIEPPQVCLRIF